MEIIKNIEKTGIIFEGNEISYNEISNNVKNLSEYLNVKKHDKVIIFAENCPLWIYSFYSVWNQECIAIPVDFSCTIEEIEYIAKDSDCKTIITSDIGYEKIKDSSIIKNIDILNFNKTDLGKKVDKYFKIKYRDIMETSLILYTSGTTGNPKGVMLSIDNLLCNYESLIKDDMFLESDIVLALLPFHHILPLVGTILCPLYIGSKIVFSPSLASNDILNTLKKYHPTFFIGVPRLFSLFHQSIITKIDNSPISKFIFNIAKYIPSIKIRKKLFKKVQNAFGGNIRLLISGGAKLDEVVAKDFLTLGFKITEGYGMTETAPMISYNRKDNIKIGTVGKKTYGIDIKIIDGEICVKGRNVMKGYYNKIKETEESFTSDGYLKTGDIGELDDEGFLKITGRKKEIIVLSNGKNINPIYLEKEIMEISPIVKEIGVFEHNNSLHAIIFPDFSEVEKAGLTNIKEGLKWNVIDKYNIKAPNYRKIFRFEISKEELPKTRLGKLRRFQLKDLLDQKNDNLENIIEEPKSKIYSILKEYIVNNKKIIPFPKQHFEIDLGLDSLDIVEYLVYIEQNFGVKLEQDDIFQNPTLLKLNELLESKDVTIKKSEINWGEILKGKIDTNLPKRAFFIKVLKLVTSPILKFYFRLKIEGKENIPKNKPFILAANHQSFLDGFIIANSLKTSILNKSYFLSKINYFKSSLMKFIAKNGNIVVIDMNNDLKLSLQTLAAILKNGKNIVIFPEGTRTIDGNLNEFKKSFAILSKELNIPILSMAIDGAYKAFPRGKVFPKPVKVKVKFFELINPQDMDIDEIIETTKTNIKTYL